MEDGFGLVNFTCGEGIFELIGLINHENFIEKLKMIDEGNRSFWYHTIYFLLLLPNINIEQDWLDHQR